VNCVDKSRSIAHAEPRSLDCSRQGTFNDPIRDAKGDLEGDLPVSMLSRVAVGASLLSLLAYFSLSHGFANFLKLVAQVLGKLGRLAG